jgi:hypothetical protein
MLDPDVPLVSQIMPVLDCSWMKVLNFPSKSESNMMTLVVMKQNELPQDHFISSHWVNVMLGPVGLLVSDHASFGLQLNKGFEFCH